MRGDYVALTIGVDRLRKKEGLVQAHAGFACALLCMVPDNVILISKGS